MRSYCPLFSGWLLGVGFALFASLQADAAEDPAPHAKFVCTNNLYEFGTITSAQSVRQVFTLCSSGTTALIISHIQACCGLTLRLASTNIPPGVSVPLEVTFVPRSYVGRVRKTFYLHTNDPEAKIVAFRLCGSVVRLPSVEVVLPTPQKGP